MATQAEAVTLIQDGKSFKASGLEGRRNEKGEYRVYSYDTVILHLDQNGNVVSKNLDEKYSQTTSRHQNMVKRALANGINKGVYNSTAGKGKGDYMIVRHYSEDTPNKIVKRNLTLEQAKKWTQDPKTRGTLASGEKFFDGYTTMKRNQ